MNEEHREELRRRAAEEVKAARGKLEYWQTTGAALFTSELMKEKWNLWVESMVNNPVARGMMVEETLQILMMFKANKSLEEIADAIENIPGGLTILDDFIPPFVGAEVPYEIRQIINERKVGRGKV